MSEQDLKFKALDDLTNQLQSKFKKMDSMSVEQMQAFERAVQRVATSTEIKGQEACLASSLLGLFALGSRDDRERAAKMLVLIAAGAKGEHVVKMLEEDAD